MMYKDYQARVEFDDDANILHGEVLNIQDVITFQSRSVDGLQQAFEDSVNEYLVYCGEQGLEPEQPATAVYEVKLSPGLTGQVFSAAKLEGKTPEDWVYHVIANATSASLGPSFSQIIPEPKSDDGDLAVRS